MDHLLQASIRSVVLSAVAAVGLWRVKSASVRHAVWMLMTASMLVQIALSPVLPEIPLRVLAEPMPVAITVSSMVVSGAVPQSAAASWSWTGLAGALYLCGLLFFSVRFVVALGFARELARASEAAVDGAFESSRIAAPLTIGNRILLPVSWRDWDSAKLRAVLAHEGAHVQRRDWGIAAMARVNRCVFWFHPLAWWLERQLARLAEEACDDAALAVVEDRELYARTLLDVARAIQISGRVLSAPMAKEANVEIRIDRILDETRRIPKALGRRGWMALSMCAAPLVYLVSVVQLAPAQTAAMAVPSPQAPQPPGLVMVAQTAAPQEAPVSPEPAASESSRIPGLAIMAQAAAPQASPAPPASAEPPPPPTYDYENLPRPSEARFQDFSPTSTAYPYPPVTVTVVPTTTLPAVARISIPLDPTGHYEISARITTLERRYVASFDVRVDHRQVVEKQITLKPGHYRLVVLARRDGKNSTKQEIGFEVE